MSVRCPFAPLSCSYSQSIFLEYFITEKDVHLQNPHSPPTTTTTININIHMCLFVKVKLVVVARALDLARVCVLQITLDDVVSVLADGT